MVRLQHGNAETADAWGLRFQSHNGSIATRPEGRCENFAPQFQSHNGSIATLHFLTHYEQESQRFNPIMVRLQPLFWGLQKLSLV